MTRVTLHKCDPNRHGLVRLIRWGNPDDPEDELIYVVTEPGGSADDAAEFNGNLAAAKEYFDSECRRLADTPNHKAQAEYDDRHGTDNGYSPWQYFREF